MNILRISFLLLACFSIQASAQTYATANLKFSANIIESSCEVNTNSQNLTVELGRFATKDFLMPGSQSDPKYFEILLDNCTAENISIKFLGKSDESNPDYLAVGKPNQSGGTNNVALKILNKDKTLLPLNKYAPEISPDSSNSTTIGFYATYISENGNVTAGNADATASFILQYQ